MAEVSLKRGVDVVVLDFEVANSILSADWIADAFAERNEIVDGFLRGVDRHFEGGFVGWERGRLWLDVFAGWEEHGGSCDVADV